MTEIRQIEPAAPPVDAKDDATLPPEQWASLSQHAPHETFNPARLLSAAEETMPSEAITVVDTEKDLASDSAHEAPTDIPPAEVPRPPRPGARPPTQEQTRLRVATVETMPLQAGMKLEEEVPPDQETADLRGSGELPDGRSSSMLRRVSPFEGFALREMVGRGGQGEVWSALQASLHREVAVKIHRSGSVQDFLTEAFTSGELDHPNIVPVYELVRPEEGFPGPHKIAMKLVHGRSWDKLLEAERQAEGYEFEEFLNRHLGILLSVCNAVAYAHSKRIIHRDLKPHQVLVGDFGEIYLLDWGMALSLEDEAPKVPVVELPKFRTRVTAVNQFGTPAYMAPEQTVKSTVALGLHTDTYLLGATLFHIVAGRGPHGAQTGPQAWALARTNAVHALPETVPAELRAIIGKSLSTAPLDRYQTVTEFRKAIEDYLSGAGRRHESAEIVRAATADFALLAEARDYDAFTRLNQRWARALELWPANREAAEMRQKTMAAYAEAALAAHDLQLARSLAGVLRDEAHKADLLRRVDEAHAELERTARQRRQLIGSVIALLVVFVVTVSILYVRAETARREAERAREAESVALAQSEAARVHAESQQRRAEEQKLRADAARADVEQLLTYMVKSLIEELRPINRLRQLEGVTEELKTYFETRQGEITSDTQLALQAEALENLGEVRVDLGNTEGAAEVIAKAYEIRRVLAEKDPDNLEWQAGLATAHRWLAVLSHSRGRLDEAIQHARQQIALGERLVALPDAKDEWRRELAEGHRRIVEALISRQDFAAATEHVEASRAILEEMSARRPEDGKLRRDLSKSLTLTGDIAAKQNDPETALTWYRRGRAILEALTEQDPQNLTWSYELSICINKVGGILELQRRTEEALAESEAHLALLTRLVDRDPDNTEWLRDLSVSHNRVGRAHELAGETDEALENYRAALSIRRRLVDIDPTNALWKRDLAWGHLLLSVLLQSDDDLDGAMQELVAHQAIMRPLVESDPANSTWAIDLAISLTRMGLLRVRAGEAAEGLRRGEEARALLRPLVERRPDHHETIKRWVQAHVLLGRALGALGREEEARVALESVQSTLAPLIDSSNDKSILDAYGQALMLLGRLDEARPIVEKLARLGHTEAEFLALAREKGLLPPAEPPPPAPGNSSTPPAE